MVKTKKKECGICCDTIQGHNREIACKHCNFKCCRNCAKTYILSIINEARCMIKECNKVWDREFLIQEFKYSFVNTEYKKHKQNLLYDLEVAKFEETQSVIESRREIDEVIEEIKQTRILKNTIEYDTTSEKQILQARKDIRHFRKQNIEPKFYFNTDMSYQVRFLEGLLKLKKNLYTLESIEDPEKEEKIEEKSRLSNLLTTLDRKRWELENGQEKTKKIKYFGHCPGENCKGFINGHFKCGLCEITVCRTCRVKIGEKDTEENDLKQIKKDHTCNEDDVASMILIKKETKPCPKCKIPIIRSYGCRQMWCTECHVAFDWQTGEIAITNNIHNPHYLEWKRKKGVSTTNNDACLNRDQLSWNNIKGKLVDLESLSSVTVKELIYFASDIRLRIVDNLNRKVNSDKYLNYRIDFIKNNITEDEFKRKLQIREKEISKYRDHAMIFDMFESSFQEYLLQFVNDKNRKIETFKTIIDELIEYTNQSFENLISKYKNRVPQLIREEKHTRMWCDNKRVYINFKKFKISSK
jgi:hypothetical protein